MRYAPNLCKMQLHKNTWKNNELNSSPVSCVYYLSENVIVSLVSVEITRQEYISTRKMEWKKKKRENQKCWNWRSISLAHTNIHTVLWLTIQQTKAFFVANAMQSLVTTWSMCVCVFRPYIYIIFFCWLSGTVINYREFIFSHSHFLSHFPNRNKKTTTKMNIHPNRTFASYNFNCENCIKWSPAKSNILTNTYTLMKEKSS